MHEPSVEIESVWDYPRPPRVEPVQERIRVVVGGITIADSTRALRVLETSHPPSFYLPPDDVRLDLLVPGRGGSVCEWKGEARYRTLVLGERRIEDVAWTYADPRPGFDAIRDHLAFYPGKVDEAWVGGELAKPQAGGFYGGWITARLRGPFKGDPSTLGW
ncbi:MAG TPA: DUF427 domain-containing protein [Candidatus Saccharimonadales bacterium]|nr:DUF427 domain-containing protein [Candidatus Saccharimonadales bacterium]